MEPFKVGVEAVLRLVDGREFTVISSFKPNLDESMEQNEESEVWYWTVGNQECDCNKALMLNRQHNLDLEVECGDKIILVKLTVGGKVVYDEQTDN